MYTRHYNYPLFGTTVEEVVRIGERNVYGNLNRQPENIARRREIARAMRARGYSYPEIAEALGYRSHSGVLDLLKRETHT